MSLVGTARPLKSSLSLKFVVLEIGSGVSLIQAGPALPATRAFQTSCAEAKHYGSDKTAVSKGSRSK
jgi:hypothetical protein